MLDGEFRPYLVSYNHEGQTWGERIMARSHADAEARLKRIGWNGTVDGELVATVPASTGPLVPLIVMIRNLFARRRT